MDTLVLPPNAKVVFEPNGVGVRIELLENGASFGEVAYWYPSGDNDIMRGEKGTLLEAAQALVNFAVNN